MSVEDDEWIRYEFVWHAHSDNVTCEKCRYLSEQRFKEQSLFQDKLFSYIWGDIWDLDANHSLAHPNCRCQLEVLVFVEWDKIREFTEMLELIGEIR